MTTIVCVLRSGKEFEPRHVQWLARQVPGIVCLSDTPVAGVQTLSLRTRWPGWWAKLEAFDTDLIGGDVLLMDLDTVVLELPQLPTRTTVLRDFYHSHLMGSGFMFLTAADRARCWDAFQRDPDTFMRRHSRWPLLGDQGFLQPLLGGAAKWGDEVRSYKVHCRRPGRPPAGTKVVCFHGQPRPWNVTDNWVPPLRTAAESIA